MTAPRSRHGRARALAAFGLVALPAVGSVFVLPAVARTTGLDVVGSEADHPDAAPVPVVAVVGAPSLEPVPPSDEAAAADDTSYVEPSAEEQADVAAFFEAAYSYDAAVALAERWGLPDPYAAKVEAGGLLRQGVVLADSPRADPTADDGLTDEGLASIFVTFGYTPDDAAVLAGQWGVDVATAEVRAGRELALVGALPHVDPFNSEAADAEAVDVFFGAGYSYDDAAVLAEIWGLATSYDAKIEGGRVLQTGGRLPLPG